MKNVCVFLLFMLMFPICIAAQDKALDVRMQYNRETKDLVFFITNKVENGILFMNDTGGRQGSLFWLRIYDVKEKCLLNIDYIYRKNKGEYIKRFIIQPGETITCTYNIPRLIKNSFKQMESIHKIEVEAWVMYGVRGQKKINFDILTKNFDY